MFPPRAIRSLKRTDSSPNSFCLEHHTAVKPQYLTRVLAVETTLNSLPADISLTRIASGRLENIPS
ncbi:hypothetical protein VFPPC_15307 [Pochonia chlamydosporia 170]|uniref:Uncharacterized protein n=1 Tax=Pochonia chlamydosporia 170 TaxID=1380566 RepID=A0A179G6P5_METCM|nr:hypothetical protein VFPPC_15307 [Pochonia chlamydosporia 170]OAQ73465.1 hypothetical protein VFPPC_15307 [Pochonia chlamydosporia 170]